VYRRREECALFVDECFGRKELVAALRKEGFNTIGFEERFDNRQSVGDEEIIPRCAKETLLIVTTDKNMILRHRDLLNRHKQCVIFTTNGKDDCLKIWVPALAKNRVTILRTWKKREPPWVGRLHPSGHLEIFDLMQYGQHDQETKEKKRN
jgi:hypothetical protein